MVFSIIVYECVDTLLALMSISVKATSNIYRWYYADPHKNKDHDSLSEIVQALKWEIIELKNRISIIEKELKINTEVIII